MEEYEVEQILKRKSTRKGPMYLVKWKGYSLEQSTWQPERNLIYLQDEVLEERIQILKKIGSENKTKKTIREKINKKSKNKKIIKNFSCSATTPIQDINSIYGKEEAKFLHQNRKKRTEKPQPRQPFKFQESASEIKIVEKYPDEQRGVIFLVKKHDDFLEMTSLQVKILYPTQLSIFYQREIKRFLQAKKQH